jgi:hypothetical protein
MEEVPRECRPMKLKPICGRLVPRSEWTVFKAAPLSFYEAVDSLQSWGLDCPKNDVEFQYTNAAGNLIKCRGCLVFDIVTHSVEGFVNVFLQERSNADPPLRDIGLRLPISKLNTTDCLQAEANGFSFNMGRTSYSDATTLMVCEAFEDLLLEVAGLSRQENVEEAARRSKGKGKAKALIERVASTPKKKSERSTMSKEAREELEERKEKIKQMELVLDMRNAKEKDKQKVIREFLSNMVDPLFPFQNQPLGNASG